MWLARSQCGGCGPMRCIAMQSSGCLPPRERASERCIGSCSPVAIEPSGALPRSTSAKAKQAGVWLKKRSGVAESTRFKTTSPARWPQNSTHMMRAHAMTQVCMSAHYTPREKQDREACQEAHAAPERCEFGFGRMQSAREIHVRSWAPLAASRGLVDVADRAAQARGVGDDVVPLAGVELPHGDDCVRRARQGPRDDGLQGADDRSSADDGVDADLPRIPGIGSACMHAPRVSQSAGAGPPEFRRFTPIP